MIIVICLIIIIIIYQGNAVQELFVWLFVAVLKIYILWKQYSILAIRKPPIIFESIFGRVTWLETKLQSIKKLNISEDMKAKCMGLFLPIVWCIMKRVNNSSFNDKNDLGKRKVQWGYFYRKRGCPQERHFENLESDGDNAESEKEDLTERMGEGENIYRTIWAAQPQGKVFNSLLEVHFQD